MPQYPETTISTLELSPTRHPILQSKHDRIHSLLACVCGSYSQRVLDLQSHQSICGPSPFRPAFRVELRQGKPVLGGSTPQPCPCRSPLADLCRAAAARKRSGSREVPLGHAELTLLLKNTCKTGDFGLVSSLPPSSVLWWRLSIETDCGGSLSFMGCFWWGSARSSRVSIDLMSVRVTRRSDSIHVFAPEKGKRPEGKAVRAQLFGGEMRRSCVRPSRTLRAASLP